MVCRVTAQDKVDVVLRAFSSASREAIRPIMEGAKMFYFHNN